MNRQSIAFVLVATALTVANATVTLASGNPDVADTPLYHTYGERVAAGSVPYRDFAVEYPPLAIGLFAAPALVTNSLGAYTVVFSALMVIALIALVIVLARTLRALHADRRRSTIAMRSVLLGTILLGPFVATRFDLAAATVTAAALAALVYRHDRLGASLLGVAVATKLYPLVLLPLVVIWMWRRKGVREALLAAGLTLGVAIAVYLPFFVAAPGGVARSLERQLTRPLQIESLGAAVVLALHHVAGVSIGATTSYGSQNLTGTAATIAAAITSAIALAALGAVWAGFAGGPSDPERLVRFAAAAVVAFVAFGKVLSPQFLLWLLVLVPLVGSRRGLVATGQLLVACLLTRLWFPDRYWHFARTFDDFTSWVVLARDLVLVGILASLVWPRVEASRVLQAQSRRWQLPGRGLKHTA